MRTRLWLVVIDPCGIAHVVRQPAPAVPGAYVLRTEEHARQLAERLNDGRPADAEPAVEAGP